MLFKDYYKHYLTLHQNIWNRRMHVVGQLVTIIYIMMCLTRAPMLLIFAPFVVYPFAWSGHYFFEKNKPAAFSSPMWAKACDWIMLKDWILGRIER